MTFVLCSHASFEGLQCLNIDSIVYLQPHLLEVDLVVKQNIIDQIINEKIIDYGWRLWHESVEFYMGVT